MQNTHRNPRHWLALQFTGAVGAEFMGSKAQPLPHHGSVPNVDRSQPTDQLSYNTLLRFTPGPDRVLLHNTFPWGVYHGRLSVLGVLRNLALRTKDHSFPYWSTFILRNVFYLV